MKVREAERRVGGGREGWKGGLSLASPLFPFSHSFKNKKDENRGSPGCVFMSNMLKQMFLLFLLLLLSKHPFPCLTFPSPSLPPSILFTSLPFLLSLHLTLFPHHPNASTHTHALPAPYPITRPLAHGQHNNQSLRIGYGGHPANRNTITRVRDKQTTMPAGPSLTRKDKITIRPRDGRAVVFQEGCYRTLLAGEMHAT